MGPKQVVLLLQVRVDLEVMTMKGDIPDIQITTVYNLLCLNPHKMLGEYLVV